MLPSVPIESSEPIRLFGPIRVIVSATALVALAVFDFPDRAALAIFIGFGSLPWGIALTVIARRSPELALSPVLAVVDIVILAGAQVVAPDTYVAIRFLAMFLFVAHAHLQGEYKGLALALLGIVVLVPIAIVQKPFPIDLLGVYETLFAVSAMGAVLFVGRLRTTESSGRIRARDLTRRTIEAENRMRRQIAQVLHDGPVQELTSMDMMLESVSRAIAKKDLDRASATLMEARRITERNIREMREEMIGLGPAAFDELSLHAALEQSVPAWARRYEVKSDLSVERLDNLPSGMSGALFGIAQEAVTNAGQHAKANTVWVKLWRDGDNVELCVRDDGCGFDGVDPLGARERGHIGLASMRERAQLVNGRLSITTGGSGTEVVATVPVAPDEGREAWEV
jgi:signal transduction histidine kinase